MNDYPKDSEVGAGWSACGPITRPRAGVHAPFTGTLDQSVDNSTNKALPWVMLAAGFGFLGFGTAIGVALGQRGSIEAEGRAVRAEVGAEFADRLAKQDAILSEAREKAAIAMDWTNQKNAELKAYRSAK